MSVNYILGVDPGPMVGIVGFLVPDGSTGACVIGAPDVVQCSDHVILSVLGSLVDRCVSHSRTPVTVYVALEKFVVGPRATGVNAPQASAKTREAIALIREWAASRATFVERRAIDVKPWTTDARLHAAGLFDPTKGMRHARDGARHALFCAVSDAGLPDPFSRRGADSVTGIRVDVTR